MSREKRWWRAWQGGTDTDQWLTEFPWSTWIRRHIQHILRWTLGLQSNEWLLRGIKGQFPNGSQTPNRSWGTLGFCIHDAHPWEYVFHIFHYLQCMNRLLVEPLLQLQGVANQSIRIHVSSLTAESWVWGRCWSPSWGMGLFDIRFRHILKGESNHKGSEGEDPNQQSPSLWKWWRFHLRRSSMWDGDHRDHRQFKQWDL